MDKKIEGKMPQEEEVREGIIEEYGFNEDDDSDTIDKLVEKEMDHSKKLSDVIGQKIKYRDKVKELETTDTPPAEPKTEVKGSENDKVTAILDDRLLEDLEYPDEINDEVKKLSKLQDISVKKALRDPYIVHKVEQHKELLKNEQQTEEATITKNNKKPGKQVFDFNKPPEVDMSTPEGRETWDNYKKDLQKQGY